MGGEGEWGRGGGCYVLEDCGLDEVAFFRNWATSHDCFCAGTFPLFKEFEDIVVLDTISLGTQCLC
jgi:hypothetical protein